MAVFHIDFLGSARFKI